MYMKAHESARKGAFVGLVNFVTLHRSRGNDFIWFCRRIRGAMISVHEPARPLVNDSALTLTQFDQRRCGNRARSRLVESFGPN